MNGLKQINDTLGHDAGDTAIRAVSEVVFAAIAEDGDAYNVGGDEIVIVLPRMVLDLSSKLVGSIVRGVGARTVEKSPLSVAAGLAICVDPKEAAALVRARADKLQYEAKARSKTRTPNIGTLAVEGRSAIEEP
jgi:diguanylate cyclase (GGDEF)-like protein